LYPRGVAIEGGVSVPSQDFTFRTYGSEASDSAPSNPYHYVGGELFTANKLAVLSPYLALIGVVAVGAIVAKRKWAD